MDVGSSVQKHVGNARIVKVKAVDGLIVGKTVTSAIAVSNVLIILTDTAKILIIHQMCSPNPLQISITTQLQNNFAIMFVVFLCVRHIEDGLKGITNVSVVNRMDYVGQIISQNV